MAKRQAVQLLHDYKDQSINGWYMSEKLDGHRCWWDGGVSRGELASNVPWANTEKDGRFVETVKATGLWSRAMNVIRAPNWFLDQLPRFPLDGELWTGPGEMQRVSSIIKAHGGAGWEPVQYRVFGSPPLETILADGKIEIRAGKLLYYVTIKGAIDWVKRKKAETIAPEIGFEQTYRFLKKKNWWNERIILHPQKQLPYPTPQIKEEIERELAEVVKRGGEGLVFQAPMATWKPERVHTALKYKPYEDAEGTVIGWKWGRKTELGSKLLGKMGALTVRWKNVVFDLSGFTEDEREMIGPDVPGVGEREAGEIVSGDYRSKHFPIGSVITFLYRDLTRDGKPKEASYLRRREDV